MLRTREQIRRELSRVKRRLKQFQAIDVPMVTSQIHMRGEQYGALQALEWVLNSELAAAPSTLAR